MNRYSKITNGEIDREIVLLKSFPCSYGRCAFCDYYEDSSRSPHIIKVVNQEALDQVTGEYGVLEVINSANYQDFPKTTEGMIIDVCKEKGITLVILETHWMHRSKLSKIIDTFEEEGIQVMFKTGVETFNVDDRQDVLNVGIPKDVRPVEISVYFQNVNLLVGWEGQDVLTVRKDIETALKYFQVVTVNMWTNNSTHFKRDDELCNEIITELMPQMRKLQKEEYSEVKLEFLEENTDFGVGE